MAGFILFTNMKPYFHFLLSSHAWSSDGLPTIEELPVSQATPEKKSTDKSPSRIQDLLSGDAFPITLKHLTIQTLPLSGWKRELCTIFLIWAFSVRLGGGSLHFITYPTTKTYGQLQKVLWRNVILVLRYWIWHCLNTKRLYIAPITPLNSPL